MKNSKIISTTLTLASLLLAGNALARTYTTMPTSPAGGVLLPATTNPSGTTSVGTSGASTSGASISGGGGSSTVLIEIDPDVTEPKDHKVNLAKLITKAIKQSAMAHTVKQVSDSSTTLSAEDKATLDETIKAVLDLQPGSVKEDPAKTLDLLK